LIDTGLIDVYISPTKYCGFCGDGIITPQIGEQCEPILLEGSVNQTCCNSNCTFAVKALCSNINLCYPVICNTLGYCEEKPVTCQAIVDPTLAVCSFNSCINGQCVKSCFGGTSGNPCCNDSNPCTVDTCRSGVCTHDLQLVCDCGGNPAFNTCFSCIANKNTTCAWDLQLQSCVNLNLTDLAVHPNRYHIDSTGNSVVIVWKASQAKKLCAIAAAKHSKVGIIVGSIAGGVALIAIIILCAVFWNRIREIAQRVFGGVSAVGAQTGSINDNPAYNEHHHHKNPLHENAL